MISIIPFASDSEKHLMFTVMCDRCGEVYQMSFKYTMSWAGCIDKFRETGWTFPGLVTKNLMEGYNPAQANCPEHDSEDTDEPSVLVKKLNSGNWEDATGNYQLKIQYEAWGKGGMRIVNLGDATLVHVIDTALGIAERFNIPVEFDVEATRQLLYQIARYDS